MMVEPSAFGFNEATAGSNSFQNKPSESPEIIQEKALAEFRTAVKTLRNAGIKVSVFSDVNNSTCPDSIFPNNWFSTHESGMLVLYPMAAPNRRLERRQDIINQLVEEEDYQVCDLSAYENQDPPRYLEGTGSLIFDHEHRIVYAAISERTDDALVKRVAKMLGYHPICFKAFGKTGELIYHTNVMLCIGDTFAVVSMETIAEADQERVLTALKRTKKEIINVSKDQIYSQFAGNMLQVSNEKGDKILVMSKSAFDGLTDVQRDQMLDCNDSLLPLDIPTIESIGGGSARCMLAEIR